MIDKVLTTKSYPALYLESYLSHIKNYVWAEAAIISKTSSYLIYTLNNHLYFEFPSFESSEVNYGKHIVFY